MKNSLLSSTDLRQISSLGITEEQVTSQINMFKTGSRPVKLVKPATVDDGINRISEKKSKELINNFSRACGTHSLIKFVPASGAATRMFSTLNDFFINSGKIDESEAKKNFESNSLKGLLHFRPLRIVFCFIFSNLQPLVTERMDQYRLNGHYDLFCPLRKLLQRSGAGAANA